MQLPPPRQRSSILRRATNASRNPTPPHLRTLPPITILRRIMLLAAAATGLARILAEAVIVAMTAVAIVAVTADVVAVGDAVADALVADALRAARAADAICLPRNMHHLKAVNPVDTIIALGSLAATTIAVRKLRARRRHPLPLLPRTRSFFRANPSQNIAASRP